VTEQQYTFTPKKAASYLGISEAALRLWRSRREGPRHFKAGEKLIRYRRADLDLWIESRLSEPGTSVVKAEQASTQMTAQH
jgi:predicted DNA-binding transcriptional regulator AlpA